MPSILYFDASGPFDFAMAGHFRIVEAWVVEVKQRGPDARRYSSPSAAAILIFRFGMDALWRVKVRKSCKRKRREQVHSRSKTYLHFNSTWITSKDFLLVFSGR